MKKILLFFVVCNLFLCCKTKKQTLLHFLDEHIISDSLFIKNTLIGGLSGIDFANNSYYFVVDDAKKPRYLKANIILNNSKIKNIKFTDVIMLNDTVKSFYKQNTLDLESIFVDEASQEINFVSEGSINNKKPPSIFTTNKNGVFQYTYQLPKHFINLENIEHNAVFEASSKSVSKKGFWVAMEGVLKQDGVAPSFKKTQSPVRITFFDKNTKTATKQYAYLLDAIKKPSQGSINLNGVTAILEYKENHFFVVERTYQSGYGSFGNVIKIYEVAIAPSTTNILAVNALKHQKYIPLQKRLVFNFDAIRSQLTNGIVDNIEGITFGPKLANGNQSLLLIADDNFQKYGKQLNQLILLEIKHK